MQRPFQQAVTDHGETVMRVCWAALGRGHDADDAWSETFLAALTAWPNLSPDTNIQAWLVRVAHRKAIDIIRARARQAMPSGDLPEETSTVGIPDHANHELWASVAALPERQRLAIGYHYLGGLSHVETAALIDSTPDAVRRAASDGLKRLRLHYSPADPTNGATR